MARNIEIKAAIADARDTIARASRLADEGPTLIRQDDTFFPCSNGRLKLRAFADGTGELIFYRRANNSGPKLSTYDLAPVPDSAKLRTTLSRALGISGRVVKERTLFIAGRTRIHIDRVEGLGDFLELEVVMHADEPDDIGVAEARRLMSALGVDPDGLIDRAYVDLLNERDASASPDIP
jgi:predicted adenylyl cyclase CyaB